MMSTPDAEGQAGCLSSHESHHQRRGWFRLSLGKPVVDHLADDAAQPFPIFLADAFVANAHQFIVERLVDG